jgi:hypothetical protein
MTFILLVEALYDKRDNFNVAIVGFPHLDNNIPTDSAYKDNISYSLDLAVCIQNI